MKSPPPSAYESRMKFFKLNPSLKGFMEEMMSGGEPHWELWEPSKSHTNALIQQDEKSTPSSCKYRSFIRWNFIYHNFFPGCLRSLVDSRMERCEWMDWMWFAHKTTPSIHSTSVTWLGCRKMGHVWLRAWWICTVDPPKPIQRPIEPLWFQQGANTGCLHVVGPMCKLCPSP